MDAPRELEEEDLLPIRLIDTIQHDPKDFHVKQALTYTALSTFRNCRRRAFWRYIRNLVPKYRDPVLDFGDLVHNALERWHGTRDLAQAMALIDAACDRREIDSDVKARWHLACAMMRGYARQYARETWQVVALETKFTTAITNPETGATSRSFTLDGKVDGLVIEDERHFLLEHKTAAQIDSGYVDRLWCDFQTMLYVRSIEAERGIKIAGVIYNVLSKAQLKQKQSESDEDFQARRAELLAKSKTGKTSATQQVGETDSAFAARLDEWYTQPGRFVRVPLLFSRDQFAQLEAELWELTQAWLDARRRDTWYTNTSQCFAYNKPCPYFELCRSSGNPVMIENLYETKAPHEELADPKAAEGMPF